MKQNFRLLALFSFGFSLCMISCKKETTPDPTLYERVGGTTLVADPNSPGNQIEQGRLTLRSVVDSSIFVIAADPQMAPYFPVLLGEVTGGNFAGFTTLSENFTDFLSVATGSTNSSYAYTGLNMHDAHDPTVNTRISMKVTEADFNAFVGDIGIGLAQNGVTSANNADLVNDLVALLNTTKSDIVQQ